MAEEEQRHSVNTASNSNSVTQREADRDLLHIVEGQNLMLAREQSRLSWWPQ
jgi:hypothetical protein